MTEQIIIKHLSSSIDESKFPFQLSNVFIYHWECDYWIMTAHGETREIEVKINRSDFFHDAKKQKHKEDNGANYFYYACPVGLILPEEVEKRYGLMYVHEIGRVDIVKKPRRLNSNTFDNWKGLASRMYWRYRELWKQKYINKEITRDEYFEGFNLKLEQNEQL